MNRLFWHTSWGSNSPKPSALKEPRSPAPQGHLQKKAGGWGWAQENVTPPGRPSKPMDMSIWMQMHHIQIPSYISLFLTQNPAGRILWRKCRNSCKKYTLFWILWPFNGASISPVEPSKVCISFREVHECWSSMAPKEGTKVTCEEEGASVTWNQKRRVNGVGGPTCENTTGVHSAASGSWTKAVRAVVRTGRRLDRAWGAASSCRAGGVVPETNGSWCHAHMHLTMMTAILQHLNAIIS